MLLEHLLVKSGLIFEIFQRRIPKQSTGGALSHGRDGTKRDVKQLPAGNGFEKDLLSVPGVCKEGINMFDRCGYMAAVNVIIESRTDVLGDFVEERRLGPTSYADSLQIAGSGGLNVQEGFAGPAR